MPLELTVCSCRRRSRRARRWTLRAVGGLVTLLVLAFVLPPALGLSRCTVTDDAMSGTMDRGSVVFAEARAVADVLHLGYAYDALSGGAAELLQSVSSLH